MSYDELVRRRRLAARQADRCDPKSDAWMHFVHANMRLAYAMQRLVTRVAPAVLP